MKRYSWLSLIFVDDGSSDHTRLVLQALQRKVEGSSTDKVDQSRVKILPLATNQGKAEAVRQGILQALADGHPVVGFWDADLATPFEEVPPMKEALEHAHALIVMGSRVRLLGRNIKRKAIRHILGRVFATCVSEMLQLPVYDTQCGAKLFQNHPAIHEVFAQPFESRWIFDVEILARLLVQDHQHGTDFTAQRVLEYPLQTWVDIAGSRVKPTDFSRALVDLTGIALRLRRAQRTARTEASSPSSGCKKVGLR